MFYWEGYSDPESFIKQYNVRLLGAPTCSEADENRTTTIVDWITVDSNYTTYKFVDLELVVRSSYDFLVMFCFLLSKQECFLSKYRFFVNVYIYSKASYEHQL